MSNWKIFGISIAIAFVISISMFSGYRIYTHQKELKNQALIQQAHVRMQKRMEKELWGKVCHYASPEYNQAVATGTLGNYPGQVDTILTEPRQGASQAGIAK